jgi:predicted transcriptional regulator of viral defense system
MLQSLPKHDIMCAKQSILFNLMHANMANQRRLYHIAEAQSGYFTAAQALNVGFTSPLLSYHTRQGTFQRVAHGVYRLTYYPPTPHEDLFVAWLRTGPNSVISHESALALYELSDVLPSSIHLIVPRTASRRRSGLRLHTNRLAEDEVTRYQGLPVTTPARTIADAILMGTGPEQIVMSVQQAIDRGLTTSAQLRAQIDRRGGRVAKSLSKILETMECATQAEHPSAGR